MSLEDWRGIVQESLQSLGGSAKLDEIYSRIFKLHDGDLAPSWEAIVRRTLGDYSADSAHFRGEHIFEQIAPGHWALATSERDGLERDDLSQPISDRIAKPFDPLQIKISRRVVTIGQVVQRIGFKEIELAPDFQRRARIWDPTRKSRLIESIMLRIPLPVFYVAADENENWRVVDGLQRLTTIYDFTRIDSEYNFSLSQLEYLSDYEGLKVDKLPRGIVRRIDETELNINVIESGTPDQVMFNIFKRLNTGGLTLNGQEIRHALNPGPARKFLLDLSNNEFFKEATDHSVSDTRMGARELALRFVAFYITPHQEYNEDDLDGFLNKAMTKLNSMDENKLQRIEHAFSTAMERAYLVFGKDAFRKRFDEDASRNRVNRALFEAWSVTFANVKSQNADATLAQRAHSIRTAFMRVLNEDTEFADSVSIGTGSKSRVNKRFQTIQRILGEEIDA